MTPREIEEYRALRATIRERGTARIWVFVVGLVGWAVLVVLTAALVELPVAVLLPLTVLAGVFEAVYSLHIGAERVGRYLQVYFEDEERDRGWEHRIMEFGVQPRGSAGPTVDPLFSVYFWIAAVLNFGLVWLPAPLPIEWGIVGVVHLLFVARVLAARGQAAGQRKTDLERFRKLKT